MHCQLLEACSVVPCHHKVLHVSFSWRHVVSSVHHVVIALRTGPAHALLLGICCFQHIWIACVAQCSSAGAFHFELSVCTVAAGMLDLKHAQEWVVTTKLGSSDKRPGTQMPTVPVRTCRFYAAEVMFSFFVLASASYGIFSVNKWSFSIFLTLQGKGSSLCSAVSCHALCKHCCSSGHAELLWLELLALRRAICRTHACCMLADMPCFQHHLGQLYFPHIPLRYQLWCDKCSVLHLCAAGLVFFAFGLNMVDCGGLLGGRLGSNVPAKQSKPKAKVEDALGTPTIGRTYTL